MARQMKDSGIEWIGEIPEGWSIARTKSFYTHHKHVVGEKAEQYERLALTLNGVIRRPKDDSTGLQPEAFNGYQILRQNELVFKLIDLENVSTSRVGFSPYTGIVSPAYIVLAPREESESKFGEYFFLSMWQREVFNHMGDDGVRSSLNSGDLLNVPYPLAPSEEKQRIAAFLDRKCAEIDAVIERTKATIEEYKKLKQAVITEAVTKGVRGARKMKDSGVEWVAEIVDSWNMSRIGLHYMIVLGKMLCDKQLTEDYTLEPYFCAANIHFDGVSQEQLKQMWFSPAEKASYCVQDGDLLVVEGGAGAGGAAIVTALEQPTYVQNSVMIVRGLSGQTNRYLRYWIECLVKKGYVDVVCNKATIPHFTKDKLSTMPLPVVPVDEMEEIADYLDEKCAALDALIAKKTALLTELEIYKKSLIYEYVTGKKEVQAAAQQAATIYPFYPAVLNTKVLRFAQAVLMARILDKHGKGIGRVKLEKMLYTIETSIGFDFDTEYVREAAGPLHESLYKCEDIIGRQNKWYQLRSAGYSVAYIPTAEATKYLKYYDKYFASYDAEIERIINVFLPYDTAQAEVVATLFAAWNDAIIAGQPFTDEDVVDDVLTNWHERKTRFPRDMWLRAMQEMRKNNLIPKGYGKKTARRVTE